MTVTSCCDTDNCTPSSSEFQQMLENLSHNGLVCPTCSRYASTWCEPSDTVQCRGEQDMYFSEIIYSKVIGQISTFNKGCATKATCTDFNIPSKRMSSFFNRTMICSKATRP
ncbi:hypothetical protein GDO81_026222 [Engystomops pustulosus]|uniref:Sodefrin-like factor n=1 Tax=Engystomops pustulosus TaxID=76066 RepID=A0AAV6ZKZ0_ENGPU|nr:hypothetical protein GDO81_026222 [Engystomops pustulosus]